MCLQICPSAPLCWSSRCRYERFRRCWPTLRRRLRGWVWRELDTHQEGGQVHRNVKDAVLRPGLSSVESLCVSQWSAHCWLKRSTLFVTPGAYFLALMYPSKQYDRPADQFPMKLISFLSINIAGLCCLMVPLSALISATGGCVVSYLKHKDSVKLSIRLYS